ncbi:hypothetical protein J6590_102725 [Homalodisca vitripennis]|nr:hypothetical protein J6590_009904 [Homalodisca vitripennis]KAG8333809.1 hypothetical protein J6590_102725 [Homalodisca vitripennis]
MDSKTKHKTVRFPCVSCDIGVKYSAIRCTVVCRLWYHGACVEITDKQLKKMNPEEVNSWACSGCKKTNIEDHLRSNNDNSLLPKSNLADIDNTLADLQQKIKELNIEEPDLETSLTPAAEVYRPPISNLDDAIDILTAELDKALTSNQAISIMGDINGDLKNAEQKRN